MGNSRTNNSRQKFFISISILLFADVVVGWRLIYLGTNPAHVSYTYNFLTAILPAVVSGYATLNLLIYYSCVRRRGTQNQRRGLNAVQILLLVLPIIYYLDPLLISHNFTFFVDAMLLTTMFSLVSIGILTYAIKHSYERMQN